MLNITFACCTPDRTLVGLHLPGEENDPTSEGNICAALCHGRADPTHNVKFNIHSNGFLNCLLIYQGPLTEKTVSTGYLGNFRCGRFVLIIAEQLKSEIPHPSKSVLMVMRSADVKFPRERHLRPIRECGI